MESPRDPSRIQHALTRMALAAAMVLAVLPGCSLKAPAVDAGAPRAGSGAGQNQSAHTVITEANACQLQEMVRFDRDPAVAVKYFPRGDLVAVARAHEIQLLNAADLSIARKLPIEQRAEAIALSPDGQLLAGVLSDRVLQWETASGALLSQYMGEGAYFRDLAYTRDGEFLVATSWDGLHVWTAGEAELRLKLEDLEGEDQVAFSEDGDHVLFPALMGSDCLQEWSIDSGIEGATYCLGEGEEWEEPPLIAVAPGGGVLALGTAEGPIALYDIAEAGSVTRRAILGESLQWVDRMEFSSDGRILAASSWASETGRLILLWDTLQASEILQVEGERFSLSPDGRLLLIGSGGSVRLHQLPSGDQVAGIEQREVTWFTLAPSADRLALHMSDGTVEVRDERGTDLITTISDVDFSPHMMQLSPDGEYLLGGNRGGVWGVWSAGTGEQAWRFPAAQRAGILSRGGEVLAYAADRMSLEVRRLGDGKVLRVLEHPMEVRGYLVSADGHLLAANMADETVWIWDLSQAEFQRSLDDYHSALAFSPDGSRLVTQGEGGVLKVWSIGDGHRVAEHDFESDEVQVEWVAGDQLLVWVDNPIGTWLWAPDQSMPVELTEEYDPLLSGDGHSLLTRSWQGVLRWRDLTSGAVRETAENAVEAGRLVAFSPGGEVFLTAQWQGPLQVWSATALQPICTLLDDSTDIQYAFFDDSGTTLAIYSEFMGLSVWGIP